MLKKLSAAGMMLCATIGVSQADDLMEVYRIALENDPQIRAAEAARDATYVNEPLARSRLLPSVSLNGGVNRIRSDSDTMDLDYTSGSLGVSVSQPLYRRNYQIQLDQAQDQVDQADVVFTAEQQTLMTRVADAYFGILAAQDNLDFVRAQKAAIDRQLDQAQQRFEVGLIAITAVHEAQAASDQARADLIQAENELGNAREALREIVQVEGVAVEHLAGEIPLEMPAPADIDEWTRLALENSQAVAAAEKSLEIARKQIEVERSARLPSVDLVGSLNTEQNSGDRDTDQTNASVGVQLNMPLWLGGSIGASTDQARYRFDEARQRLDRERRQVIRQVRDAYRAVEAGISSVRALQAGIVSAQSALEATQAGFEVGTRTMVDVLNAEQAVYGVKSNHASARYGYVLASLQLRQAAGILSEEDLEQINQWIR